MKKTFKIAKWEIRKNITNKTFLISIILTPILILIFGALPALLEKLESGQVQSVYIVDELEVFQELENSVDKSEYSLTEYNGEIDELEQKVVEEKSSYMVLNREGFEKHYFTMKLGDDGTVDTSSLQGEINRIMQGMKLEEIGIDRDMVDYVTADFSLSQSSLLEKDVDIMSKVIPAVFAGLILFSVFMSGMMSFQSASQEKRDKMTEILLSSVEPKDIMQGKILGYFVLGLIQVLVWGIVAGIVATYRFDIPVIKYLLVAEFPLMLLYALLGYLLYSSLFVSMGATINDIYASGNFQGMIMVLPMMPIFFVGAVISNPHGIVAKVGSFFPFSTSGVMLFRLVAASKVPLFDIILTLVILIVTIFIVMKLAGKVFKTALLMYGKNATPAEIIRWIRQ